MLVRSFNLNALDQFLRVNWVALCCEIETRKKREGDCKTEGAEIERGKSV